MKKILFFISISLILCKVQLEADSAEISPTILKASNQIPDSFDWRERINFGKFENNQNSCASSWAYATLEMLEALYAKEKGIYIKLSEQMLIDCDTYDDGCNGGTIINALKWIKANGIMKAEDYPYRGTKGTCKADPSKYIDMKVTGYRQLGSISSPADEEVMKQVLYEDGPYIVGINSIGLYSYKSGILDLSKTKCPPNDINHFPLLVGYGSTERIDYWIIKNSWGSSWGERGYFRIARGKGVCGINSSPIIANVSFE